jgi:hypothetical protein
MPYVTLLFTLAVAGATEGSAAVGEVAGVGLGVGVGVGGVGVGVGPPVVVTLGAATVNAEALTAVILPVLFSVVMALLNAAAKPVGDS